MHVVRAFAGHESITTTDRYYLQVSPAEMDKAAGLEAPETKSGKRNGTNIGTNGA